MTAWWRGAAHRAGGGHRDRGATLSVEWAIFTPLVLLVVLGIVQGGVLLRGRDVARQSAMAAAEAQAAAGARAGTGDAVARRMAADGGLTDVHVVTSGTRTSTTVTVDGQVALFFDLGQSRVRGVASVPKEVP